VIGTATLSTPIGQTSLGNYIFCRPADPELGVRAVSAASPPPHSRSRSTSCWPQSKSAFAREAAFERPLGSAGIAALVAATLVPSLARAPSSYIVGAKTFAEQYVLSALIAQRLRATGLSATTREGLGSNVIFEALASGDIDVYVDYSGTLWANQFHHSEIKPRQELLAELKTTLAQQNVTLLGELGFEKRLRAGDAEKTRRGARHSLDRRSHITRADDVDGGRLRVSSRVRNGPDSRKLMG